ncbi:MAG TPA: alpha/beta hydrolase [Candidatus Riflebacteria bacterium]|jgi:haloalkane dehalogenase|nr:alpha/beta hydrolase [Candidatus Riflebacteria bacterium]
MTFNHAEYQDIYPFTPHHFTHQSGLKQHYVDAGNGEPIVMVHGNPSWSFLYRDMIRTFMSGYRCIAPDHIGCGLSDKPGLDNFGYTLREHIDNLETLIESLQLTQPINLVVHDWGGAIGMGYATRHPEKIKRMVILNTGAFRLPQNCPFPWPVWLFRNTDLGACLNQTFNAFSFIASHTCSLKGMSRKVRHGFRAPYDSPANRVATTRFVQDIPLVADDPSYTELVRVEENLSKLADKPALICFGRLDFVFTRHFYNEWKRHFPKAIARNFHAGHYLLEDVGSEVFTLMRELLESRS